MNRFWGRLGRPSRVKRCAALLLALLFTLSAPLALADITVRASEHPVKKDGWYDSMEEVAVYLTEYDALPGNYLTKKAAQALGWSSSKGNLWDVADGKSIGGDRFGNYEGLLPEKSGRRYTECDIDFDGGYRGGKRIVFSNDGLIYYTQDHYASFERVNVVQDGGEEDEEDDSLFGTLLDTVLWLFE